MFGLFFAFSESAFSRAAAPDFFLSSAFCFHCLYSFTFAEISACFAQIAFQGRVRLLISTRPVSRGRFRSSVPGGGLGASPASLSCPVPIIAIHRAFPAPWSPANSQPLQPNHGFQLRYLSSGVVAGGGAYFPR